MNKAQNCHPPAERRVMLPCPFCGGTVHLHNGYKGMNFITCGQRDDGRDGCGAVVSFRPDVRGEDAKQRFNMRATMPLSGEATGKPPKN